MPSDNPAHRSLVKIRSVVPDDAFTAAILGSERVGNGVVINSDGLILTIGYLIAEATDVWLTANSGPEVAGHALAYDQVTGFGPVSYTHLDVYKRQVRHHGAYFHEGAVRWVVGRHG